MNSNRLTEFLAVLVSALALGAAGFLITRYLQGNARFAAIIVMIAIAVLASRTLRKRFGRE